MLEKTFYSHPTIAVARALIGTFLLHDSTVGRAVGRIVETEAYLADDPACHAYRGPTKRNASMFGPAGTAYVYLIYGMYHCFNVVTAPAGVGEAVLIRALEPVSGVALMAARRRTNKTSALCSGPGKLVQALGITQEHDGVKLARGPLRILSRASFPELFGCQRRLRINASPRIGISDARHLPLRFTLAGNRFLSRPEETL